MQQLEFKLNGEFIELNQLLKMVGVCDSGGAGEDSARVRSRGWPELLQ